jgi:hypothetical protein
MTPSFVSKIKSFANDYYFPTILLYIVGFVGLYTLLYQVGIISKLPNSDNLIMWDAGFYNSIKSVGYLYHEDRGSNVGFFPFFPYFWKFIGLGSIGMGILNGIFFLSAVAFLSNMLKPKPLDVLLFLCLPCGFYFFIPQTEALFFVFCTGMVYAILRNKPFLIFLFIYFATLTRPSYLFFFVPFWGITLMSDSKSEPVSFQKWLQFLWVYILPMVLGAASVAVLQYSEVGMFFGYYKVQAKWWGREFGMPVFPLGTSGPTNVINLSYLNFWLGSFFVALGVGVFYRWLSSSKYEGYDKVLVLCIGYLSMAWASVLFFNPEWAWVNTPTGGYNTTYLVSINRFMECNVFLFIAMTHYLASSKLQVKYLFLIFLLSHLTWFLVVPNFYTHIQNYLKLLVPMGIITTYFLYHYFKWKPLGYALAVFSLYYQCIMLNAFFSGVQID